MKILFVLLVVAVFAIYLNGLLAKKERERKEERKRIGTRGESKLVSYLDSLGWHTFSNLYVPVKNGRTTELDAVLVHPSGIYVIECKNYHGKIKGTRLSHEWTVTYGSGKSYRFYNPILQNKGHVKALRNKLPWKYSGQIHSVVVFMENPDLSSLHLGDEVMKFWEFKQMIEGKTGVELLNEKAREGVASYLRKYDHATERVKKKHIIDVGNASKRR